MKNIIRSVFLVISIMAFAQNNTNKMENKFTKEETEVLEVARDLTRLMIARDIEGMNAIVDKDFTLTHITGYVQPKKEWFKEVETESMKYYSAKEVKNVVEVAGDKAQFIGQNILDARIWGTRNHWRLQQTMQLEKRNQTWIILNSVAKIF